MTEQSCFFDIILIIKQLQIFTKIALSKYAIQLKTISNDVRKNRIADNKKIKLVRFWESDINNNLDSVIEILKKELQN